MSDCCLIPHPGSPPACPMNGEGTKPVGRKTVECLVRPEARTALTPQPYYFCNAPDCDTVYVSALGDHLITKDMLSAVARSSSAASRIRALLLDEVRPYARLRAVAASETDWIRADLTRLVHPLGKGMVFSEQ